MGERKKVEKLLDMSIPWADKRNGHCLSIEGGADVFLSDLNLPHVYFISTDLRGLQSAPTSSYGLNKGALA